MKKKVLLSIVLLLSLLVLILSVISVFSRSSGHTDPVSSGTADPSPQSPADTQDVCAHVLSAQWSAADGFHYHECVMPDCSYTDDKIPCSGGAATCTEKAICEICGTPYGVLTDHQWRTEWDCTDPAGHAHSCIFGCGQHSELQPHIPGPDATEEAPQVCVECNYEIAPMLEHVHTLTKIEAKDASCTGYGNTEYFSCTGCASLFYDDAAGSAVTDAEAVKIAPLGHDFAAPSCTSAQLCQRPGCQASQGQPLGHSPKAAWNSDANSHWHICSVCGERTGHASHHPGPAATEQTPQTCTVCGYVLKTQTAHVHAYDPLFKYDASAHWYECACGQTKDKQNHFDTNKNSKCDICGYQLPKEQASQSSVSDQYAAEGGKLESILQPAQITLLRPEASGVLTKSVSSAIVDYSNSKDGYVMVKFTESTSVKLKVQVQGPYTTYTYNIRPQEWTVLPLSDGNGNYSVKVFKNVTENRYSTVLSLNFTAALTDEFAPFLRPNQYVNFENAVNTMNKAAELAAGKSDTLEKVKAIYNYIIKTISYDYQKAATVQSGYLPDLEQVLADKKGICFDYAALMAGMLRSQNIACKLVIGYADTTYHAWISVWTPDKGWIDEAIFFDGIKWQMMDPTYASSAGSAIVNQVSYTSKYIY